MHAPGNLWDYSHPSAERLTIVRRPQEKWDANSPLGPDEQMTQIFGRFIKLPVAERQVCRPQSHPVNEAASITDSPG